MLRKLSLTTQFALVFLIALALVGAASWLILDRIYINQLKSQAETVADNVDAFGSWVAQYGRVWVKDNDKSYLGHMPLLQNDDPGAVTPKLTPVNFYSKNPALAQREFSEVVEQSASPAKFAGSTASSNPIGSSGSARPTWICAARSASAYASGNTSFGMSASSPSQATALSGAALPSTRIDAGIRGSMPTATDVPATASSWRVRSPVGPVHDSRRSAGISPVDCGGIVSG